MTRQRISLLGFGNVGQALVRLLQHKQDLLLKEYGLSFSITGIATGRHGIDIDPDGIDIDQALRLISTVGRLDSLSPGPPVTDPIEFIRTCGADVLFENTPVNYTDGQPAVSYLRAALQAGMHAITANKGPVVHAYQELTELAGLHGA